MMKITYFFSGILLVVSLGCQKEIPAEEIRRSPTPAKLIWEGAYEVDGCGFFILLEDKRYKPENEDIIDDSFKVSSSTGIDVLITYRILGETIEKYCGDLPNPTVTTGIKLISLERK